MAEPPLGQRSPSAVETLLSACFTLPGLSRVRREVEAVSRRYGLTDDELVDWITAVNELMINTIRHGGGQGTVRLLRGERLTCEVTDHGPGLDTTRNGARADRPPLSHPGGRGLWLVQQTADHLQIDSSPTGTTVRITARTWDTAR